MKWYELVYWYKGVHATEHQQGHTKTQAQGVIVRRYLCDIDWISVKECDQ